MATVDDLPKMVSLSPEPLPAMDEKSILETKLKDESPPRPRHNWDAEVIEALLQQDIDLGLTRHDFDPVRSPVEEAVSEKTSGLDEEWQSVASKAPATADSPEAGNDDSLDKIWAGLDYTIDSETGEYMLLPSSAAPAAAATVVAAPASADSPPVVPSLGGPISSPCVESPMDEALLAGPIPTTVNELMGAATVASTQEVSRRLTGSTDSSQGSLSESDSEMALLDQMIEAAQGRSVNMQTRAPLNRLVSMEQRWQDLASVLLLPPPEQESALPVQDGFMSGAAGHTPLPMPSSLSQSAGSLSPVQSTGGAPGDDLTYFQLPAASGPTVTAAAPLTAPFDQEDVFLSQLLDVNQLDLSAAPITELAPQDWSANNQNSGSSGTGAGSGSGAGSPSHPPSADRMNSSQSGLNGFGSFRSSSSPSGPGSVSQGRSPRLPVAQKKHLMYGKRFFQGQDGAYDDSALASEPSVSPCRPGSSPAPPTQGYGAEGGLHTAYPSTDGPAPGQAATAGDQAEIKYSSTAHFATTRSPAEQLTAVAHNHSYHHPTSAEGVTAASRPVARDKAAGEKKGERLSRDEKRLRSMDIPLTADDIVHLPMDDFNERLAKLQLTEAQLSLVRDVRRRGKNKLAAQNCRKRKLDQITSLTEDLQKVRDEKQRMLAEHQFLTEERVRIRDKYSQLHRHVFQSLRDPDNQPYSASEYSLQLSADGHVLLVPRAAVRGAAVVPAAAAAAATTSVDRHKSRGLAQ